MWWGLVCWAGCSFNKSWHGEAFHKLGVQSADVSDLPYALPQPSMSPASQQSPWFKELMRSAAVSQLPSWISSCLDYYLMILFISVNSAFMSSHQLQI
jgi:hypothetical protein